MYGKERGGVHGRTREKNRVVIRTLFEAWDGQATAVAILGR